MSFAGLSALVVGAGGLGCPAATCLAAAGVGRLTLLDDDRVEPSNLARQMLFSDADVGAPKVEAAARALALRFPAVEVNAISRRFGRDEASRVLLRSHDVVLDGTDNFTTRFAVNDLCVEAGIPLVHGAALGWLGQMLAIVPGGPCLRCVFEDEPPEAGLTCADAGVISPLVGLVGGWMANAATSILRGEGPPEASAMRILDGWAGRERLAPVGPDPDCPVCTGPARTEIRARG